MPYLPDLNTYLHNSSLLQQAYPSTRITTKYSLPRRPNSHSKRSTPSKRYLKLSSQTTTTTTGTNTNATNTTTTTTATATPDTNTNPSTATRERKDPSAILTLKTFHPESGICLKYRTDKAQEVGRLIAGLGRLARGEVIELPVAVAGGVSVGVEQGGVDAMDVDSTGGVGVGSGSASAGTGKEEVGGQGQGQQGQQQQGQQNAAGGAGGGGSGGGKKKKKGKK